MRRVILHGGQNRNCQGLKLSKKWFFTRRKLIKKKRNSDNETQTLESCRRDTCLSTLQIQNLNQNGVICTTRKEEEEENKSAAKPRKKSGGDASPDSRLSPNEIFTTDYNYPTPRDANSILGAPSDTYERLSDIRSDHGELSGVKWPLTKPDLTRYRIEASCSRADSPTTAKNARNAEENSYGIADKMSTVFSPKSFEDISKKALPTLRVMKKSRSNSLRRRKLIAVKGCFTKRKKVAKCNKKKKKDTDNEVGISRDSDDFRCAGNGKENEQIEKFENFFCEPSGSQDLTKCSSKCQNIMKTKSNHRSLSEMGMKTESTKKFKSAKGDSSKSEKEEWEEFSLGSKKRLEKVKPITTHDSFPNEKVSSAIPRGRQIQRDKEISSVMTIWHWLRRRHRVRGAAVSASAKQRIPSFYNGSSGQDIKDPFLSLFFPLIARSGFLKSTGESDIRNKGLS